MRILNQKERLISISMIVGAITLAGMAILDIQHHEHQESIMPLINCLLLSVLLFCSVIFYFQHKGRTYMQNMVRNMQLNEKLIYNAVQTSNALILIYDLNKDLLQIVNPNKAFVEVPEFIPDAQTALAAYLYETEDIHEQLQDIFSRMPYIDKEETFTVNLTFGDSVRPYLLRVNSVQTEGDIQFVGALEDLTEQEHLKRQVSMHEGFLTGLLGFVGVDVTADNVLHVSEKMSKYYREGMSYSEFLSLQIQYTVAPDERSYVRDNLSPEHLQQSYQNGIKDLVLEYQGYDTKGQPIWRECEIHLNQDWQTENIIAYLAVKNIDADKQKEFMLLEKASRDYLTGLYNRGGAEELINQYLKEMNGRENVNCMFVLLDLDNFKEMNDTLGHQMGDRVLQDVAAVLQNHFREYDIVSRLAGDEFVVLVKEMPPEILEKNMQVLLKKLEKQYNLGDEAVLISASIGVSIWPGHGSSFAELYRKADLALYHAKDAGKKTFVVYGEENSEEKVNSAT